MGDYNQRSGNPRKIVAKFAFYKDREMVRRLRTKLNDTQFYLHEQFPPEIVARRKSLLPKLKNAKKQGRQAWLAYDTLFIDGVPVSDKESEESDRSQMQNGNRKYTSKDDVHRTHSSPKHRIAGQLARDPADTEQKRDGRGYGRKTLLWLT
ncbi:uncharacterized protein LOC132714718 [Ruditapes philippinarum]|uniref:uncharacterized protein LOC132714718 n=1 Tax=Ruditapes philippinarum TaxID=129788 RepID=UPI00295B7F94|nr:uncharacterized protein LOC132714718 [Ruditapes philippinarum]